MNGSRPFLNLCFTRGSKHDLNPNENGGSVVNSAGRFQEENDAQPAIHNVPNNNVPFVFLTLHAHVGPIVLLFLCSRKPKSASHSRIRVEEEV